MITGTVKLTDGIELPLDHSIPDVLSVLGLKVHARRSRDDDRDVVDLLTRMELLVASREVDEFRGETSTASGSCSKTSSATMAGPLES